MLEYFNLIFLLSATLLAWLGLRSRGIRVVDAWLKRGEFASNSSKGAGEVDIKQVCIVLGLAVLYSVFECISRGNKHDLLLFSVAANGIVAGLLLCLPRLAFALLVISLCVNVYFFTVQLEYVSALGQFLWIHAQVTAVERLPANR